MKEHPILFSGGMVKAILEGRKTQTRRVMKEQDQANWPWPILSHCPYGAVGDRLWVREAWRTEKGIDKMDAAQMVAACLDAGYSAPWAPIRYEADKRFDNWDQGQEVGRLRPSIHMPRWASRITLEVVNVRVERLRDISEADAKAEGADFAQSDDGDLNAFNNMWDVINEKRGFTWMSNPWVWVIEFRRVTP